MTAQDNAHESGFLATISRLIDPDRTDDDDTQLRMMTTTTTLSKRHVIGHNASLGWRATD